MDRGSRWKIERATMPGKENYEQDDQKKNAKVALIVPKKQHTVKICIDYGVLRSVFENALFAITSGILI